MVLVNRVLANKGIWIVRRTAAAAAADYLCFYADAVRHHRAAVPLLVITFIIGFAMFLIVELERPANGVRLTA